MNNKMSNVEFELLLERAAVTNMNEIINEIPSQEELKKMYPVSERHKIRMENMFKHVRRLDILRIVNKGMRVAAVSFSIIVMLLFGTMMVFSPTVRAAVSETIIEWFDGFTSFKGNGQTVENVKPIDWYATYLPDGFYEQDILDLNDIVRIDYTNSEGVELRLRISTSEGSMSVDNEDKNYWQVTENGVNYHFFESLVSRKYSSVIWHRDGFGFEAYSTIPINEIYEMAKSVRYK
jgi:hypothetical protein